MSISRKELLIGRRRLVIKVGTKILADRRGSLNENSMKEVVRQISMVKQKGKVPIVVSSGAIAAGRDALGFSQRALSIHQKQAAAAVGQIRLMWTYKNLFNELSQQVAQILLTHEDFRNRRRFLNARSTLLTLLERHFIPVINENDSVAIEEIKVGDNDNLAALVSNMAEADLLIILTDTDGLLTYDPEGRKSRSVIPVVEYVDEKMRSLATNTEDAYCVGGMVTKIEAAEKAAMFGIPTVIANGNRPEILEAVLSGEEVGTLFLPKEDEKTFKGRKSWIALTLKPSGDLVVDKGCKEAIMKSGSSLLPSGILDVKGKFEIGDLVSCRDFKEREFARGLVSYSSSEVDKIKGIRSSLIEKRLGYRYRDEVIHRDDLVVL